MSEVKRIEIDHKGLPFSDENGVYVFYEDYEKLAVQLANAESKCRELAAESKRLSRFISGSCYVFDGDHDDDMPDEFIDASHYMPILTPTTDEILAEVRSKAIPEGYVLVPQQIFLEPSDIESICSQCGDGHESGYGDFTDGLLWVGSIQRDDGSIAHGLHISSADYPEEGGITICEFDAQLRKGAAL